ncbi:MAG: 50S ribosomal protein L10 [Sedimentisphaerales bacterium]|nr:50S ribosomal protein L10 [Sedimentisphaerales bacterium]
MSRKVKGLIQNDLEKCFQGIEEMLVVSLRGVGGIDNNEMRRVLAEKNIHVMVVKNSLARRAFEKMNMGDVSGLLSGPCAVAWGGDSVVDIAKELVEWGKKLEAVVIKGGYLEGKALDAESAKALSKMPSRAELQATVVNIMLSPGRTLAAQLTSPAGRIAGCIKTLVEKMEEAA